jgi:hypothetical protein
MGELYATREPRNSRCEMGIGIVVGMPNYQVVVCRAPECLRLFAF